MKSKERSCLFPFFTPFHLGGNPLNEIGKLITWNSNVLPPKLGLGVPAQMPIFPEMVRTWTRWAESPRQRRPVWMGAQGWLWTAGAPGLGAGSGPRASRTVWCVKECSTTLCASFESTFNLELRIWTLKFHHLKPLGLRMNVHLDFFAFMSKPV